MFLAEGTVDYLNGKTSAISFDDIYPIGSIYISMTAGSVTDLPAAFTAGGRQWTRVGTGRCLWGANEDNSNLGAKISGCLPAMSGSATADGGHQHTYYDDYIVNKAWAEAYDAFGGSTVPTGYTGNVNESHTRYTTAGTGSHTHNVSIKKTVYSMSDDTDKNAAADKTVRPTALGVTFWQRVA